MVASAAACGRSVAVGVTVGVPVVVGVTVTVAVAVAEWSRRRQVWRAGAGVVVDQGMTPPGLTVRAAAAAAVGEATGSKGVVPITRGRN